MWRGFWMNRKEAELWSRLADGRDDAPVVTLTGDVRRISDGASYRNSIETERSHGNSKGLRGSCGQRAVDRADDRARLGTVV